MRVDESSQCLCFFLETKKKEEEMFEISRTRVTNGFIGEEWNNARAKVFVIKILGKVKKNNLDSRKKKGKFLLYFIHITK